MKRNKYKRNIMSTLYPLPSNYKLLTFLGQGGFGEVLKCIKQDTKETVAVKIPQHGCSLSNELSLLNYFKWKNLDECNIVRFIDSFLLRDNRCALVFEMLDMTLRDFLFYQRDFIPLYLHEVRSVVQQMATALHALKTLKVIHSDIKLDNIMLVDREAQPLTVKLIDFGLAFRTSIAKQGGTHQATHYRAPEIIIGLPFSEAIDMWSLGVVMGFMVLGDALFPGNSEYDTMRCIVELLGVPPDHLLCAGMYSTDYFVKRSTGHWRLKRPQEYWGKYTPPGAYRAYHFRNLDDVETLPLVNLKMVEADERKECIDLLKAMLRLDSNERITPSEVLAHPFITRGTLKHSSDHETLESSTSQAADPGTSQGADPGTSQAAEPGNSQAAEPGTSQAAEPGISQGTEPGTSQAAEPENSQAAELGISQGTESGISQAAEPGTSQGTEPGTSQAAEPGTIQGTEPGTSQAAEPENSQAAEPGASQGTEPRTSQAAESGTSWAAEPGTSQLNKTKESKVDESVDGTLGITTLPPGIIFVQPPPTACGLSWEEEGEWKYETCISENPGSSSPFRTSYSLSWDEEKEWEYETCTSGSDGSVSPTIPPGVILVRPAPPKWDEDSGQQSEACPLDYLSKNTPVESSRRVECKPPPPLYVPEDCNMYNTGQQDNTEPTAIISDDAALEQKKKKNCFKRFCSWMKRTFCCCIRVDNDKD
ncbi:homeodomain-interacting protein kinase 1-like isoform X2 [Thunnus thynnus]|uniref:homeodomain-interacting protein kinase 1-like isoform X2 n=1 Tax=Thunnus thynnus TaxID=8237 RepID=UPI003528DD53